MRRTHWFWKVTLCAIIGATLPFQAARATESMTGSSVIVPAGQTIHDDLFAAGNTVSIQGDVAEDVTAFGGNIALSSVVHKAVLTAGGTVTIPGPIGDDLRAAGGTVTLGNTIARNLLLAGGTLTLTSSARVGRDADIAGGNVMVAGRIGRNLRVAAAEVRITSQIGGTAEVYANHLVVAPGAVIQGNLVFSGPRRPEISPGARVVGRVDYHYTPPKQGHPSPGGALGQWLFQFLSLLVLGLTAIGISRPWVDRVADIAGRQVGASLLAGLLGLLVPPLAALVLLITVIGIPLSVAMMMLWIAALLASGVFVSYRAGLEIRRHFGRQDDAPYVAYTLGALVVSLAIALPWIGGLAALFVLLLGLGALILERRAALSQRRAPDAG